MPEEEDQNTESDETDSQKVEPEADERIRVNARVLINYVLILVVIALLVVDNIQVREFRRSLADANDRLAKATQRKQTLAGVLQGHSSSDADPDDENWDLVADPALPKDVLFQLEPDDGSEPFTVKKREASAIIKSIAGTTYKPAQDRYLIQQVTESGRQSTLLLDRQLGNVWRLSKNGFTALHIEHKTSAIDINTSGGDAIDIIINRTQGRVLRRVPGSDGDSHKHTPR
jgi:hypothetical protein